MKQLLGNIEALPSKRIYLSIIADYHLDTALCELIDNAIDNWTHEGRNRPLQVTVDLDYRRQTIQVADNSGGVEESQIHLIVSPGQSRNTENDSTIGIFGVGSKRAVVALAEEIKIYSRHQKGQTVQVEINDDWIKDDSSWELQCYKVDDIDENTTKIELLKLRNEILQEEEDELRKHLGVTYALFLNMAGFSLSLNGAQIAPITFEKWSYPPDHEPKRYIMNLDFGNDGTIELEVEGGLTQSGEPSGGEYGAYIYCNDRLITKAYKGPEVGYKPLRIGNPHPSVSLARVLVKVKGPAKLMPWNSSKSDIDIKHPTFKEIQQNIERVLTHYATLSKRWSAGGGWEENVFQYDDGVVVEEDLGNVSSGVRVYLPPIPRVTRKKYPDVIKTNNKEIAREKPWVTGLYETIIAVDEISRLKLSQKNRISLLMLDSMLEIAFKEYLVNDSGTRYSDTTLEGIMTNRTRLHDEIKKKVRISAVVWKKIEYYYKLRSELVHKRAVLTVSDEELNGFRDTVQGLLKTLFNLNFTA